MKTTFSALAILALLLLSDCAKKIDFSIPSMTATIGGVPFESTSTSIELLGNSIRISGGDGSSGVSMYVLATPPAAGTFQFDGKDAFGSVITATQSSGADFFSNEFGESASEGSVTITEINKTNHTASGTFSGKVKRDAADGGTELQITDGKFSNLPYTETVPTSTLSAKIGQVPVVLTNIMVDVVGGKTTIRGDYDDQQGTISIRVNTETAPGSYQLPNANFDVSYTDSAGNTPSGATTGEVDLIFHDRGLKKMIGTFNYTIADTNPVKVTNGNFVIYYRE